MRNTIFKSFIYGLFCITLCILATEAGVYVFRNHYARVNLPQLVAQDKRDSVKTAVASTVPTSSRASAHTAFIAASQETKKYAEAVPVILYHGVVKKPDGSNMVLPQFIEQMRALKNAGYRTVSMEDFYAFMKGGKQLPEKSFLLTFDDGRKDSYYPVDPVLEEVGFNAVMFVIVNRMHRDTATKDFHLSVPEYKEILKTHRWELESHSENAHNDIVIDLAGNKGRFLANKLWLAGLDRLETEDEFKARIYRDLLNAKNTLEREFGISIHAFAFPFGDFGHNSINFPGVEAIVLETARSLYPMNFYQEWWGKGDAGNYPAGDISMIKRITIKPEWTGENLVQALEKNRLRVPAGKSL